MTEQELKEKMRENLPEPSAHFDERIDRQLARLTAAKKPKMKIRTGIVLAFAMVLVLAGTTALAAFNENVNDLLYRIWPHAAQTLKPVNLVSESQGIRMEVTSATLNGTEALVTLTFQDLEGDRIDETVDLFDSANLLLPYDGYGTCMQTDYDAETHTASFAMYMKFNMDGRPVEEDKVSFRVSRFLARKKKQDIDLTPLMEGKDIRTDAIPVPQIRGWGGSPAGDGREAATESVHRMQVLNPLNSWEIPVTDGVTLTGVGIIDNVLHVQIRYADIGHTDNHGFLTLADRDGNTYDAYVMDQEIGSVSWFGEHTDSWEEYLFDHYPADLSQMVLQGKFTTAAPATEGDWCVTFPLSLIRNP